jgi:hypothetical protein
VARDYGGAEPPSWRRGRRLAFLWTWGSRVVLVIGLLVFASLPTMLALSMGGPPEPAPKPPVGPPCRPITQAQFYRGYREGPKTFVFLRATFTRRRGNAECRGHSDGLAKHYPVCEFNAPIELAVTAAGKHYWYDVGPGYSAVVEAPPGGPRCTITGRFRL